MRKSTWKTGAVALSAIGVITIALSTPSSARGSGTLTKQPVYDVQSSRAAPNVRAAGSGSSVEFSSSARTTPRNTKWK